MHDSKGRPLGPRRKMKSIVVDARHDESIIQEKVKLRSVDEENPAGNGIRRNVS